LFVAEENYYITPALEHCPYNYNSFWYGIMNSTANNESNIYICNMYYLFYIEVFYIRSDEVCTHIGE